jgi:hypothetical protein
MSDDKKLRESIVRIKAVTHEDFYHPYDIDLVVAALEEYIGPESST